MPVHLLWGDDDAALHRAAEELIAELVDPAWSSMNLTRLDGGQAGQAEAALEAARTPPLGGGCRLVLLQRSPFTQSAPQELGQRLEASLPLIPENSHLVLCSPAKPDARLRSTKALRAVAAERSFNRPAPWDDSGQLRMVREGASARHLELSDAAAAALVAAVGNDSGRLAMELEKLALLADGGRVEVEAVTALCPDRRSTSLEVGESLLRGETGTALRQLDALLALGEPPLRIVATLTGQIRGWLWVALLEGEGERDVAVIAQAAGIRNPKRIYVLRRQLQGQSPERLQRLLTQVLEIEVLLKRGQSGPDAFRSGLLMAESG
ncbi:DNA polymerase III subunit delta [Synechococcus sp. RSCCF101]|uniref:DNA polymerase III subunit delta n=1 Tax=Synechococcus sp. RSCCF101 TaxID=2511069 RepID=UPI0012464C07|nr:DNA polymerase III subunit delta [Synechococcus sp. RSCCF101]QEY32523.1 DNA polymerase III subunit delta [Synechococcus sp. RSCCF101]